MSVKYHVFPPKNPAPSALMPEFHTLSVLHSEASASRRFFLISPVFSSVSV
jgi:hypothetical protein